MKQKTTLLAGAALLLGGCAATSLSTAELDAQFKSMMAASFRSEGIATVERLNQDAGQQACSSGTTPPLDVASRIVDEAAATIRPPSDGNYLGDWREGEKLAQSGRGLTWSDKSAEAAANGGGCYNCHQIAPAEVSFGTIGPSLYHYAKTHQVPDPRAPGAAAALQYTWGKIYNSWASNACSNMPRFGFHKMLDETQMRHLMALLLDPKSPVNSQ